MTYGKMEKLFGKYGEIRMLNFWKDKNVFVTGADGFIGSWIAKTLVENGANVVVVMRDFKASNNLKLHRINDDVTLVQGDIIDYTIVERIINEYSIDTCFHLAAQALVGVANRSPLSTFESNIKGTWNILEACRLSGTIQRLVVASSDKAYGVQKDLPYTENSPLLGNYPYDASKACVDILSRCYFTTYQLPIAVTRNANVYGGGDLNFSRIIPDTICSVLQDKQPIIRSDGTPERDYLYIKDAVNAYLVLAENLNREDVRGEAFNFGNQKPISALALVKLIINLIGKNIEPKILNEAKNEIDRQYLSIEKAAKILNWKPQYSLEEGLKETIDWYRDYLKNK
jgi:CDP-glucose 4,6-dehydratase